MHVRAQNDHKWFHMVKFVLARSQHTSRIRFCDWRYTRCTSIKYWFQTTDGAPEQFVLQNLTLRHYVVSSTSVKRTQVINWKNVRIVLRSICRNLHRTRSNREQHPFIVFIWRKLLPNHVDYFEKLMVNMLHRKIRVNEGFGVSKVVTSTHDKKEDKERGKPQKNSKMWNCKHFSAKMIRKNKNNLPSNWALVNKLFPTGHAR